MAYKSKSGYEFHGSYFGDAGEEVRQNVETLSDQLSVTKKEAVRVALNFAVSNEESMTAMLRDRDLKIKRDKADSLRAELALLESELSV